MQKCCPYSPKEKVRQELGSFFYKFVSQKFCRIKIWAEEKRKHVFFADVSTCGTPAGLLLRLLEPTH